jgi:hypothetical protein
MPSSCINFESLLGRENLIAEEQTTMARTCARKGCRREATDRRYKWCKKCRDRQRTYTKRSTKRHPEAYKARNRKSLVNYFQSNTPKAIAYRKRHKKAVAKAHKIWCQNHPRRRVAYKALQTAISGGKIRKPKRCQALGCRDTGRLIASGLKLNARNKPQLDGFVCWRCFWKIKRGEKVLFRK